jgi:ABC-2 type transport system ATP-binding protein
MTTAARRGVPARRARVTAVIEIRQLTKRYGAVAAVDGLTFRAEPGRVTGFLGPNGAGKTTTLRTLLGAVTATSGEALVDGRRYADLAAPSRTVGALLDAGAGYPGRRARTHLRCLAAGAGIPARRVDEVLEQVGLAAAAGRRIGTFSLGMRQRLGLAAALLGDPAVLVLDEPVNGLDVDGIRWVRGLLRELAGQGRTVLVSSHLLAEVEQTADRLVVVAHGRLLADTTVAELAGDSGLEDAYVALTTAAGAIR